MNQLSWEPTFHLNGCLDIVENFWTNRETDLNPQSSYNPLNEKDLRCNHCGRKFSREQDLKSHLTRKRACPHKPAELSPLSKTAQAITRLKKVEVTTTSQPLKMGSEDIKIIYDFNYLGHLISCDGDQLANLECRKWKAQAAFCRLRRFWTDNDLSMVIKIRLYETFVLSIFSYGSEVWILDDKVCRKIRAWNSRNLHLITEREYRLECTHPTSNVIVLIRKRRAKWLRYTFTQDRDQNLRNLLRYQFKHQKQGDIFQDMPNVDSAKELEEIFKSTQKFNDILNKII